MPPNATRELVWHHPRPVAIVRPRIEPRDSLPLCFVRLPAVSRSREGFHSTLLEQEKNMRKGHWCFAAAILTACVCGTGYYTYRNPDSVLVQCAWKTCALVNQGNPVVAMVSGVVATMHPEEKLACRPGVEDSHEDECLPDEPAPNDREPAVAEPRPLPALEPKPFTARLPEPIVIPDDEPITQAGAHAAVPDDGLIPETEAPKKGAGDDSHTGPRIMPYSPEEDGNKPAPYATGEEMKGSPLKEAVRMFQKMVEESQDRQAGSSEESEPGEPKGSDNVQTTEPAAGPASSEDYHHYQHRYSVCPYSGKCVELPEPPAAGTSSPKQDSTPAAEEQEPKEKSQPNKSKTNKDRSHKPKTQGGLSPSRSDLDTMEFRPSDHNLNEYTGGPY
jgi:hypothetical protein